MAAMAPPPARKGMRLSVKVLALEAENAHGLYRDEAIAAFQEKNLALPVQLDETLEQVWARIEQRYKANYLSPAQRAAFTIKRLQDAYDCDLDLSDTVGAIFEGETDPSMRMIKVVPSYVNRDFSVPVTSKLIPGHLQQARKRHRESSEGRANKRQRSELRRLESAQKNINVTRDQPIPSTESDHTEEEGTGHVGATDQPRRSQSESSLVFVNGGQTGHAEFGLNIKNESPELGHPPEETATTATSQGQSLTEPLVPASQPLPPDHRASKPRSSIPRASSEDIPIPQFDDEVMETDYLGSDDTHMRELPDPVEQEVAVSPELDTQEAAIHQSPKSTPQALELTPPARATKRRDVYDVPSSPEFLIPSSKSKKTYSRSPHNSKMLQKGADLLNQSRLLSASTSVQKSARKSLSEKAHEFQLPKPDDIESTPKEVASNSQQQNSAEDFGNQEDLTNTFLDDIIRQTPNKSTSTRSAKPGSLKKPTMKSLPLTPVQARRNIQPNDLKNEAKSTPAKQSANLKMNVTPVSANGSKEVKLTPKNQARLASLQEKVRRGSSLSAKPRTALSKSVVESTSRPSSSHSGPETNFAGKDIPTSAQAQPIEEPTQNNDLPSQPDGPTLNDAAQPSGQVASLQRTPIRSPVPLPSNVRPATSSETAISQNDAQAKGDASTFKKPAPRLSSSLTQRQSPQSSDRRRSTPLRNEVPLTDDPKQLTKLTPDVSIRHLSGSSNPERTPIRSEVPLPPNMRRSISTTSSQAGHQVNAAETTHRSNTNAKSSTPVETSVKRRGRASRIGLSSPTPSPEPIPAAQHTANSKTVKATPTATPITKADAEQPHVISSGESSTDGSDSDEEEPQKTTQDLPGITDNQASRVEQVNGLKKASDDVVVQNGVDAQDEAAQKTVPWNTQSWGFQGLDPSNRLSNQSNGEPKSGQAEESTNPDFEPGAEAGTKSRSESAAASTRSSPVVSRAPARFLSHTPTPDASESEDDVEENSVAPSKTAPANIEPESETDTSSDEEEEEEEEDEEDIEMPDVSVEPSSAAVPSSPPLRKPPSSTPFVPETSQIPVSHHGSSQSISAQASDRRRRPTARGGYGSYKTITEQLKMVENQPLVQKKAFDPRTSNLTSLLNGKKTGSQVASKPPSQLVFGVGLEDDSDESSSSSSSDSDSD